MSPLDPRECPICGAKPGADGRYRHDIQAHEKRKAEDWSEPGDAQESTRSGAGARRYVEQLCKQRPDLADRIREAYEAGLRGEFVEAETEQVKLSLVKPEPELRRPRRPFGERDDD